MYREHETSAKKGSVSTTQLVLPTNLREGVMEVAHDSILGGHLGGKKNPDRVTSIFHWPEVAGDVQRYVESCDACQRTIPIGRNVKIRNKKRKAKYDEQEGCDHSKPDDISQVNRRKKSVTIDPASTNAGGESETHDISKANVQRKRWNANETEDTGNYEPCDEKTWLDEGKCQRSRPKWKDRFYLDKSIMYREHETSAKKGSVSTTQLVLPTNLREGVMEVAHDSILGGHLGGKKNPDRVTSIFHWPEVAGDVQRYVESCDACQRTIPIGRNVKIRNKKRKAKYDEQEGCDHSKPDDISQVNRRKKSVTIDPASTNAGGESETHDISKANVQRKRWNANETEDTGNYEPCDEKTQKKKSKPFHANTLRKYVSREKNEDKRMNCDAVQGLQLVNEDQDSQLGSE